MLKNYIRTKSSFHITLITPWHEICSSKLAYSSFFFFFLFEIKLNEEICEYQVVSNGLLTMHDLFDRQHEYRENYKFLVNGWWTSDKISNNIEKHRR